MNKCPLCGTKNTGFICSGCGFDLSCDFERFPTLSKLERESLSLSKKKALRREKLKNSKRCEVCGGYSFYFDEKKYIFTCTACGEVSKLQIPEKSSDEITHTAVINNYNKHKNRKKIISIAAGDYHTVALKEDGTVSAIGNNYSGQCNVGDWENISGISAGGYHTVGLRKDGTVTAVGKNDFGQCNVQDWKNITAVSVGCWHTVGLKNDGTVIATGENRRGQCDVLGWKDIVFGSAGDDYTVGVKSDGTVVSTKHLDYGQSDVEKLI